MKIKEAKNKNEKRKKNVVGPGQKIFIPEFENPVRY